MAVAQVIMLLCSMVALSTACCTPDQWEGEEATIGGYAGRRRAGLLKVSLFYFIDCLCHC